MTIFIDSREQANTHIVRYLDKNGIKHVDTFSNEVGDYYAGGNVIVERKKNLVEWASNCGKGHQRFKRELTRLDALKMKMYILIEEPINYMDMERWTNPRGYSKSRVLKDGTIKQLAPMDGKLMLCISEQWKMKHNIEFVFCEKKDAGAKIVELLTEEAV